MENCGSAHYALLGIAASPPPPTPPPPPNSAAFHSYFRTSPIPRLRVRFAYTHLPPRRQHHICEPASLRVRLLRLSARSWTLCAVSRTALSPGRTCLNSHLTPATTPTATVLYSSSATHLSHPSSSPVTGCHNRHHERGCGHSRDPPQDRPREADYQRRQPDAAGHQQLLRHLASRIQYSRCQAKHSVLRGDAAKPPGPKDWW